MNIFRWVTVFLLLTLCEVALSQEIGVNGERSESAAMADSLFNAEKYNQALPLYLELFNRYPKDTRYNYALGVCYLRSTRNVNIALPYLLRAASSDAPNKVYFYIAETYRKLYRFDLAIDYYRRFTINGGSKDIKSTDIERYLTLCENGNSMLKYVYSPQILDKKRLSTNEFYQYYSILPKTGSLVPKPDNLKSVTDVKENESSVIFYPNNPQAGDYIYYSSYGKSTINGKDIYRIKRLEDGFWSKPENLGTTINSQEDEDFPYLASDGKTLYFASKGHYSMGGYDIYRSVFDSTSNKWGAPENIGFPISSVFDDILYIPDAKDSLACFATNRNCEGDSLDVFIYKVDNNPIRRSPTSEDEIINIASLPLKKDKSFKKNKVENEPQDREVQNNKSKSVQKQASFNTVQNDPEYIRVITNGFAKQKETDSLRVKLEKLRAQFDNVTTAEQRRSLESKVVKVENALLAAQNEADKLFVQASQIEQEYLTGKRKPVGTDSSIFATDNPDYIYQAQFAATVFRTDEITKLAQVEKLQNQINSAREEAVQARSKYYECYDKHDSTLSCGALNGLMVKKMNAYVSLISKWFDVKYKIYNDCIMVAMVKSGNNNADDAKAEIERANNHFRAALAIKNNLSEEGKSESMFEASLLNELGILRLELAFARIWGMNLFEQQTTSRALKLEKIAFGNTLPPVLTKPDSVEAAETKIDVTHETSISKVEPTKVNTEAIVIKDDAPPSFLVVDESPYNAQNPIPVNEQLPVGVIYKIQLGAFSRTLEISSFKGMVPVSIERIDGAKVSKYFVGKFTKFSEAEKSLAVVRTKGFRDAFIVSWLDGKSIPTSRAQSMEGKQVNITNNNIKIKLASDSTNLKNKIYQVLIGKYSNKLPDGVYQTVKAIASGKDIIRKQSDQGQMVYLIGNYTTIEDANRIKDNLIASGLTGVEVIAIEVEKK